MNGFKKYGINIPHIITWIILLINILFVGYEFYFNLDAHINDKDKHLSGKERIAMQVRLKGMEDELENRDIKVEKIVRKTISELKKEGYLK